MNVLARLCSAAAIAALCAVPRAAQAQAPNAEPEPPRHTPAYLQMRGEALGIPVQELQFEGRRPRVWGAIMELGLASGSVVTLVVYADGTTSLYSSGGGGIVDAGNQAGVRETSDAFLQAAQPLHNALEAAPEGDLPLPEPGRVRFHLRTNAGVRTGEVSHAELEAGSHRLSPLFTAGQAVLNQLRPRRQQQAP